MLTTLAMLTALSVSAGQETELKLSDARTTYGVLGPARTDLKLLPGDSLFVTFNIDGISADENGKVLYSIANEVTDSEGKAVFKQPARDLDTINALGGGHLPAYAQVDIGLDQPAGNYQLKVTVKDRSNGKTASLTQDFQVAPKGFGLLRLTTTSDPEARMPAGQMSAGQSLWINGIVVGFARNKEGEKQPNVMLEMRVLDENGKPTLAKPFSGVVNKDVPSKANSLPIQFHLGLNRPGKFTVELKATCAICGESTTQKFPVTVYPNK